MNFEPRVTKGRKYDQVLKGAREVFLAAGFEGASVDDIAKASKVSKATLYKYFTDKRLLFIEVANVECQRQAEIAIAQIQSDGPVSKALYNSATIMARFLTSDLGRQTYRIAVGESERFPEVGRAFYFAGPSIARNALQDYLRGRVQAKELVIDDVELAADQFIELCKASHHIQSVMGVKTDFSDAEIDRVIKGAVKVFLRCYGTGEEP